MKRILVAGAAGFIGSHLCEHLLNQGHEVIGWDNLVTGREKNIAHLFANKKFHFQKIDIIDSVPWPALNQIDQIYNMASPASPIDFTKIPIAILKTSTWGHANLLELAFKNQARILFASTSEVYGDPLVHPQKESYWGNVNPIGIRGCYDEAKRSGEAMSMAYHREKGVNIAIARIFNTYGPRMRPEDGRVIPNFFIQALKKEGLTLYGKGLQTRSLCYVQDLVEGLVALMNSSSHEPTNLGNPQEMSILELANTVNKITGNSAEHRYLPLPPDDPQQRRPDIQRAQETLKWSPHVSLEQGLQTTLDYFKKETLV